jgi:hypothetical protein
MSMGAVEDNQVANSLGIGIFCGDHSICEIDGNSVSGTRPDVASGDRSRLGYGIVAHYGAAASLRDNSLLGNPRRFGSFLQATISTE